MTWSERIHRCATGPFITAVGSCTNSQHGVTYSRRLEKVKFGVSLSSVCKNGIPGPLLVLILKLNKEAQYKRDVFRAPGHEPSISRLVEFLQSGRLINFDHFSIHTIASVLKKFLRKLPDGIFGSHVEERMLQMLEAETQQTTHGCLTQGGGSMQDSGCVSVRPDMNTVVQCVERHKNELFELLRTLPMHTQHLLVLVFGTFRVVATNSECCRTGMSSQAIGVSVAPSLFHRCVGSGRSLASVTDVNRFKIAMRITKFLIDNFGVSSLFGRENYIFYARVTGRILRVEDQWIFSYRYPPDFMIKEGCLSVEGSAVTRQHIAENVTPSTTTTTPTQERRMSPDFSACISPSSSETSLALTSAHSADPLFCCCVPDLCNYLSTPPNDITLYKVHERQRNRLRSRSEWFLARRERVNHDMSQTPPLPRSSIQQSAGLSHGPHHTVSADHTRANVGALTHSTCTRTQRRRCSVTRKLRMCRDPVSNTPRLTGFAYNLA